MSEFSLKLHSAGLHVVILQCVDAFEEFDSAVQLTEIESWSDSI